MNILIDIGHPAHVHLLHPLADELRHRGHAVHFAVRELAVAQRLMRHYGMTPWLDLGDKRDSLAGKAKTVAHQALAIARYARRHHIDCGVSSGVAVGLAAKIHRMNVVVMDDDDDAAEPLVVRLGHPLADAVLTPDCIRRRTPHAVYYPGTHELAYLHPNRFQPDPAVLRRAGLAEGERFFIVRFVAFKGHHDVGQQGLTLEQKRHVISLLEQHGRVIITSERAVEPEFERFRLPVPPEEIHSLMAYATLFVGDSQTMTSEAAVLGVPALKCNTFAGRLSVPNMLEERYGLCYAYTPDRFGDMSAHIEALLARPADALRAEWQERRQRMLADMSDPTEVFLNTIERICQAKR